MTAETETPVDAGELREYIASHYTAELLGAGTPASQYACESLILALALRVTEPVDLVRRDLMGDAQRLNDERGRYSVYPLFRALARLMYLRDDADTAQDGSGVDACEREVEALVRNNLNDVTRHVVAEGCGVHELRFDFERSDDKQLLIEFEYWHPDGGKTTHVAFVRPCMVEPFDLRIGGHNRGNIKKLLKVQFREALLREIVQS